MQPSSTQAVRFPCMNHAYHAGKWCCTSMTAAYCIPYHARMPKHANMHHNPCSTAYLTNERMFHSIHIITRPPSDSHAHPAAAHTSTRFSANRTYRGVRPECTEHNMHTWCMCACVHTRIHRSKQSQMVHRTLTHRNQHACYMWLHSPHVQQCI